MLITYEYECGSCGYRFERDQAISDKPVAKCPKCGKKPQRLISGGSGFIWKGGDNGPGRFTSVDDTARLGRTGRTRVTPEGKSARGKGR
ncbi:MAG: zinc ribbon domain-containing protein [Thermodesulfobacteriota bacterium]